MFVVSDRCMIRFRDKTDQRLVMTNEFAGEIIIKTVQNKNNEDCVGCIERLLYSVLLCADRPEIINYQQQNKTNNMDNMIIIIPE